MGRQSPATIAKRRVADITEIRTEALGQMNAKLRTKFRKIENSVNDIRAENLRYYYQIGQLCEEIRNESATYVGKDGTDGLRLIEQALSTQARTLRKAAMFARMCSPTELEEFINWHHEDTDFRLHWGHISFLLTLETKQERAKYAEQAVEQMLEPPALHEVIKKGTNRSGGHGRKHEMPTGVPAQIRQILKISKQWADKNSMVWNGDEESVFGNMLNLEPDTVTDEMVEQLVEMKELMLVIEDEANNNVDTIERIHEHFEAVLKQRAEAAAAEEEVEEEEEEVEEEVSTPRGRRTRAINLGPTTTKRKKRKTVAA